MHVHQASSGPIASSDVAPNTLVLGNVGVVRRADDDGRGSALVDDVGADALCVALDPAIELVQPGGDRDFTRGLETMARLVRELGKPVVVKETGCGIGPRVCRAPERGRCGARQRIGRQRDVVGSRRSEAAAEQGDTRGASLGEAFWDWGIPTAASVALLAPFGSGRSSQPGGSPPASTSRSQSRSERPPQASRDRCSRRWSPAVARRRSNARYRPDRAPNGDATHGEREPRGPPPRAARAHRRAPLVGDQLGAR